MGAESDEIIGATAIVDMGRVADITLDWGRLIAVPEAGKPVRRPDAAVHLYLCDAHAPLDWVLEPFRAS